MAEVARTPFKQRLQMAGAIVGSLLTLNTIFWIAAYFYYDARPDTKAMMGGMQIAFGGLTLIVAIASYFAALAPRLIGHVLAGSAAIAMLVGGIAVLASAMPPVLGLTMVTVGIILPVLIWRSLLSSRAAWLFLIALVAVIGTVTFFGAPKIRTILGIGIWYALIIPALSIVCVIALSMLRREYRDY